jgi:hypothetical protein
VNDTVFLTCLRFRIEAPEGFLAHFTRSAHTKPELAGRSTSLLVSIIAFILSNYTQFNPTPQAISFIFYGQCTFAQNEAAEMNNQA